MLLRETKISPLRRSFLIFAFILLLGITTCFAQASAALKAAPLNPEFTKFISEREADMARKQTGDGHWLGHIPAPLDLSHLKGKKTSSITSFPPAYDLRTTGKLSPVKDQGPCGSCWAFATCASLESYLLPSETWDFSENNLKNTHGFDWGPCSGGNHLISTAYLARWSGPVDESEDPYSPYDGTSPPGLSPKKHAQQVYFIPDRSGPLDNGNIKQAIMEFGAVFTSMYYNSSCYHSSNYTYYYSGSSPSNHAVSIVGWDDNFDRNLFKTPPPGDGAFIVKNSWGTGWGQGGYFYISYYDSKAGKDNAVFTAEAPTNYADIYQYDPLGWVNSIGDGNSPTLWFANVFNTKDSGALAAVSFYAASPNSTYELYIYKDVSSLPNSGMLAAAQTGVLPYPGYNTIDLGTPVTLTPGQKYSVAVKLTTPGYNYPCPVECSQYGYSSAAKSNPGESWASSDGSSWEDLYGLNFGNACLKAFTTGPTGPAIKITSPNGGERWKAGSAQTISWTYTGDPGSQVKVELLKGGALDSVITPAAPTGSGGSGSFTWTIPQSQAPGSDYAVRVTSTSDSSCTDTSDSCFTIAAAPETTVGFDPDQITVYKNPADPYSKEFVTGVKISGLAAGQEILSFRDVVSFDPSLLEVVNVELPADSFLNPVLFSDVEIDNAAGKIDFNMARSGTAYPGSGGVVYNITMRAKNNGTAVLQHTLADLRSSQNQPLTVNTNDAGVNITSITGDFTGDGKIDFDDLEIFSLCWKHKATDAGWDEKLPGVPGSPFKQADIGPAAGTPPDLVIEADGKVDFEDLSAFAWMWNWARNGESKQASPGPAPGTLPGPATGPACTGCCGLSTCRP